MTAITASLLCSSPCGARRFVRLYAPCSEPPEKNPSPDTNRCRGSNPGLLLQRAEPIRPAASLLNRCYARVLNPSDKYKCSVHQRRLLRQTWSGAGTVAKHFRQLQRKVAWHGPHCQPALLLSPWRANPRVKGSIPILFHTSVKTTAPFV